MPACLAILAVFLGCLGVYAWRMSQGLKVLWPIASYFHLCAQLEDQCMWHQSLCM